MNKKDYIGLLPIALLLMLFTITVGWFHTGLGILAFFASLLSGANLVLWRTNLHRSFYKQMQQANFQADSATRRLLLDFFLPCVLVDEKGFVLWFNTSLAQLFHDDSLVGRKLSDLIPPLQTLPEEQGSLEFSVEEKLFSVLYQPLSTGDTQEKMYSVVLFDITQQRHIQNRFEAEHVVVGTIVIDNYGELVSGILENERTQLIADVETKLFNWAALSDGIIYRLERDRFAFIFNKEHLDCLVQNKFSILNDVKEIKNSKNIPTTLSIGIGYQDASIAKSAVYSRAALELALGRGGDQTVLKQDNEYSFFGGNSRETEKRTKVKARVMANALCELIENAPQVLIMGHKAADLDSIGSAIGIYAITRHLQTPAKIVLGEVNSSVDRLLQRLKEAEPAYKEAFLPSERAKDMVTAKTLVIVVDTHKPSMVEAPEILDYSSQTVLIDHHRRSTEYLEHPVLTYHEPYASSTSEMITEILQYTDTEWSISKEEAEALFAGITLDTKNFMVKSGVRTFDAAAFLRRHNVDTTAVRQLFRTDLQTFATRAKIVESSEIYRDVLALAYYEADDSDLQIVAHAADEMLNITNIEASFVLCLHKNVLYISARSTGSFNVQLIMEQIGGGGHMTVAGTQIPDVTIQQGKEMLCQAIDQYLESTEGGNHA